MSGTVPLKSMFLTCENLSESSNQIIHSSQDENIIFCSQGFLFSVVEEHVLSFLNESFYVIVRLDIYTPLPYIDS